ncbi:2Fe-2S iron-sulfur cluster-binding protein [Haloglomus litoreum]|uniref:2Fe-2S iron-sulfur cluster-binding protein n=1 Tax=Haloglomus litoreum TaxID=3034026 RepID=UPI0023E7C086|nr:2Fe-2S iron-sulfur cluster-binding protein [Haloglomus sp. DT116]
MGPDGGPGDDGDGPPHRLELERADGSGTTTVTARAAETVLEAAERADTHIPFGCRTGACATCTAELLSGTVEHRREPRALKPRHREAGYVLTCIAVPTADCRLRVGSDVAGELTENPWR